MGLEFHEDPWVGYIYKKGTQMVMAPGMMFTIEPMVNLGGDDLKILSDGWTAVTRDMSMSAQFEHSLAVTKDGYEIFTYSPAKLDRPPYKVESANG